MAKKLLVTSSPHYRSDITVRKIMLQVILSLVPVIGASVVFFGWRSLFLISLTVISCVIFELVFCIISRKSITGFDFSSVVTGLLLAFTFPVSVPFWIPIAGAFFAVVVVKMLFGGTGCNFVNPALAARAFLFSWPTLMTSFTKTFEYDIPVFSNIVSREGEVSELLDSVSSATPLSSLKNGGIPTESFIKLLVGNNSGSLGETCVVLILLGGIFLLIRGIITWHIPVSFIGTVAVLTFIFPLSGGHFDMSFMLYELLSGGLVLGAVYMATDSVTSPVTSAGKIIYGIGCGVLTVFLRYFSGYTEGVMYAILIMNVLSVPLDKLTMPRRFGKGGGHNVS